LIEVIAEMVKGMNNVESCEDIEGSERETDEQELLSRRISDLSLKIQGTRLEALIARLYRELEKGGISLRPKVYLSDEWGCPQGIPVIGIPFYLADRKLCKLEGELTGVQAENEVEIMMYLRHEAGHAFNYAYILYLKAEWRRFFGTFRRPYKEEYRTSPFSARFVRHVPGWYAQKHPDEDFAETFAVWLTPGSDWQTKYKGTRALSKLMYVDRLARRYGRKEPLVSSERLDKPVQDLTMTLDNWFETVKHNKRNKIPLKDIIDEDLRRLFPADEGQTASEVFESNRSRLIREVNFWTGADRHVLSSLFDDLLERVKYLDLRIESGKQHDRMISAAAFIATLAMNYQTRSRFVDE
jgi:hypothetical protein